MFEYPLVLVLLITLLPLAALFLYWREHVRAAALRRVGDPALVSELAAQVSPARRRWKAVLWMAATAALILALARPVWGVDVEILETQGVTVMVVLDVSRSMDAVDAGRISRLELAKLDLRELFNELQGNEIGLILFAGSAYVQLPPTNDIFSATTFLEAASSDSITHQGSSIEDALRLAVNSFDPRSPAQKVIVLVSDGENQEGDPLKAAKEAADQGITIYTLGYGSDDGAVIPVINPDGLIEYKADESGSLVMTRIHEDTLQAIAETAGGIYQRATGSGVEIVNLAQQINAMKAAALNTQATTRPVERFGLFVAVALLALSLEMLMPETRGKTL